MRLQYHKLNNEPWMKKSKLDGEEEEERRMTDDIVTSTVAIKSVAT